MDKRTRTMFIVGALAIVAAATAKFVAPSLIPLFLAIAAVDIVVLIAEHIHATKVATSKFECCGMKITAFHDAPLPDKEEFYTFFLNEIARFVTAKIETSSNALEGYVITYRSQQMYNVRMDLTYGKVASLCSPWTEQIWVGPSETPLHTGYLGHEVRLCLVYEWQEKLRRREYLDGNGHFRMNEKQMMCEMNAAGIYNNGPLYGEFKTIS